jgi:hypothetical protein
VVWTPPIADVETTSDFAHLRARSRFIFVCHCNTAHYAFAHVGFDLRNPTNDGLHIGISENACKWSSQHFDFASCTILFELHLLTDNHDYRPSWMVEYGTFELAVATCLLKQDFQTQIRTRR